MLLILIYILKCDQNFLSFFFFFGKFYDLGQVREIDALDRFHNSKQSLGKQRPILANDLFGQLNFGVTLGVET